MNGMYITTFYSFKGGVGRTMALVNTAVTLAQRGRNVLVVDFDVEAPGLDTFDVLRPQEDVPGIVDFVVDYVTSGIAPDATKYVGDCPSIGDHGGKLWIMPSGRIDTHAATLGQIDWMDLYERLDGYLLFEDLKAQWSKTIQPDYVLIDSRTGHTDSSGICTRQLPDSVVILFFPNAQNLRGLTQVVRAIRAEVEEPRRKDIALHFVASMVPYLDDEDQILEDRIMEFREELGIRGRGPIVVHRYEALSLLNQAVFSTDRPRSRLAKEYDQLVLEISSRNWNDRDGALEYIRRIERSRRRMEDDPIRIRDERLEKIEQAHKHDGEVLFRLGEFREQERQSESALELIGQAIHHGYASPDAFLKRSRLHEDNDEPSDAIEDSWRVLKSEDIAPSMVREAVMRLLRLGVRQPGEIVESNAAATLEAGDKLWLAMQFDRSHDDLLVAASLCEQILTAPDHHADIVKDARNQLGMKYMGLGRCAEAVPCFRDTQGDFATMSIDATFNYGMARWGADRFIDLKPFERVIEIDQSSEDHEEFANYLQCMAVSYWMVGETENALNRLNQAEVALTVLGERSEFSCWRYLQVSASVFREDLSEIQAMIEGHAEVMPRFMVDGISQGAP